MKKTEEQNGSVAASNAGKTEEEHHGHKEAKDRYIKVKESQRDQWIQEARDYKDKYLRLCAEFDNARKRMEREKQEFVKYASQDLLKEFLGVVDNLERTVEAAKAQHQDYDSFLKGIEMVMNQLHGLLAKQGVKPIEAVGKPFDHNCHEVLMQEESDQDDGMVLEEYQKGYYLQDRVLRTAKVKVAKKREGQPDQGGQEALDRSEKGDPTSAMGSPDSDQTDIKGASDKNGDD